MYWQTLMVRKTRELAAENTGVQLQFLLQRLEAYPDAWEAITNAVKDMAAWNEQQAEALRKEIRRRHGGAEIIDFK